MKVSFLQMQTIQSVAVKHLNARKPQCVLDLIAPVNLSKMLWAVPAPAKNAWTVNLTHNSIPL